MSDITNITNITDTLNISDVLFDDLLILIVSYLDNKDSHNFVNTSKNLRKLFMKEGYFKTLKLGNKYRKVQDAELFDFHLLCCDHINTLNKISFENIINPHRWIPREWPKYVYFKSCTITDYIDPDKSNTEIITFRECNKGIKINFKKFPKLIKVCFEYV